ncbi:hypothetical protein VOLCADRAFT_108715 [Volvox carteri f. nagariensis]|uniref:Uncharacterized protein n=1 Tax=Volvox carteri f. nagariensis TaxID=3068 RepID=D8UM09_VOLCA|nr:uncharacterized protein VOLCADRAFT_108715 [Volvox carteri f. nagariensis]EFJ39240.1 hypothetical protein VOLCADRAFT_108715 [Volvox carteri f. nagariensis]|eukprot:XP_002959695.1 hypothetical protein VOLCADRAFT_108715 [Volvox carteri f. nagariensis]
MRYAVPFEIKFSPRGVVTFAFQPGEILCLVHVQGKVNMQSHYTPIQEVHASLCHLPSNGHHTSHHQRMQLPQLQWRHHHRQLGAAEEMLEICSLGRMTMRGFNRGRWLRLGIEMPVGDLLKADGATWPPLPAVGKLLLLLELPGLLDSEPGAKPTRGISMAN